MRHVIRLGVTLYICLLVFCVVSVYILSLQSEGHGGSTRCHGYLTDSCRFEHERQDFERALRDRSTSPHHSLNFENSKVNDGKFKSETNSGRDEQVDKNLSLQAQAKPSSKSPEGVVQYFPALYRPVLANGLNCTKVWLGDENEISWARRDLNETKGARRSPGFYDNIVKNCSSYRQSMGYVMNVSKMEESFPLAFSILLYKDVEQVERLLRAVYRPHNVYCLHVDRKASDDVMNAVRSLIKCLPNVIESPRRISVVWGKFSVLEPELICMDALWRMRTKWKYFINLTGQEFPLKTNKELVKILEAYKGANDIEGRPPSKRTMWRYARAGPPPHGMVVAKGPVHVAASRGFVDFHLHSEHAHDLLAWTRHTSFPEETYFVTLNKQHQLGVPGSFTGDFNKSSHIALNRLKNWDTSGRPCGGRFIRHICHFGLPDVARLAQSRHMIANKFTYDYQPLAYDCLEQWYFERVRREHETGAVSVDTRYYRNLDIVKFALRKSATEAKDR